MRIRHHILSAFDAPMSIISRLPSQGIHLYAKEKCLEMISEVLETVMLNPREFLHMSRTGGPLLICD